MQTQIHTSLKSAFASAVVFSAMSTMGRAEVLFRDEFTGVAASSGDAQTSAGLNSVGWYMYQNNAGGQAWTTGTDNTSPLSGGVMKNPGGSSANTVAIKQFASSTLTNVGDSITLSMDLRALGAGSFNVSLLQSAATVSTNQYGSANPLADGHGYGFLMSSTQDRTFLTAGTGSLWEVTNGDPIPYTNYLTNVSASTPMTTLARTLTLTLTKTAGGVQIGSSFAGTTFTPYQDTSGNIFTSFNTIRIYGNGALAGMYFDNISVAKNVVPEPSPMALVLVAGGLCLVRSRRS